jgi:2'-5' RNA ligase
MIITAGQSEKHDYACLMVDFDDELKSKILQWNFAHIPESALVQDAGGRELKPHVTLKYGLLDEDPEAFFNTIPAKPIAFTLATVSRFDTNPDYDVLKIDVVSDHLGELNEMVSTKFKNEDSHPEYKPHLTLAYVKKGALPELDGNKDFAQTPSNFTTVLFTNKNNDMFKKHLDEGQALHSMYKPIYYKKVPIRIAVLVARN